MPVRSVTLRVLGDDRDALNAINYVTMRAEALGKMSIDLHFLADTMDVDAKVAELRANLEALTADAVTIRVGLDDQAAQARLVGFAMKLTAIADMVANPKIDLKGVARADLELLQLTAAMKAFQAAQEAAAAADAGGGGGFWSQRVPIWGGLASIKMWHLLADAFAEVALIAVPAIGAILTFGAALTATAPDLQIWRDREVAMYTATDVLHQKMYGLTGSLTAIANTLKPDVWQVWGDAITIANANTGEFAALAQKAMGWIDSFAARITVDLTNGSGTFRNFVNAGARDLSMLGQIFDNIGHFFMSLVLVGQRTHIAEDLLGIVGVASRLLAVVGSLIRTPVGAWVATAVIGLHGLYVWGGLAAEGITRLVQAAGLDKLAGMLTSVGQAAAGLGAKLAGRAGFDGLAESLGGVATKGKAAEEQVFNFATGEFEAATASGGLSKILGTLGSIPVWGWIGIGVIALGGLVFWMSRSKDAADQWAASLTKAVSAASNFNVFNVMSAGLGQAVAGLSGLNAQWNKMRQMGDSIGPMVTQNAHDTSVYTGQITKLTGEMTNFARGTAFIEENFKVGYPEALAIASAAHVNLSSDITGTSKAAAVLRQQIVGLMLGYTQLQGPSGIAGQDFAALAYAGNDLTQKMQQLNSAWDTFTKNVTAPQSSFDTLAQGLATLSSDSGTFTWHLGQLTVRGTQTKAAIDSLTASGINLNQAFTQEIGNANAYLDSLRTTGVSQGAFTTAVKASVAALLPYAAGSQEAAHQVYLLAQQADYTGNVSIASLSNWAGIKAKDALGAMKTAADNATTASSNLANALQNLLNVQFQQDIMKVSGAQQAMLKYTQDLINNQQASAAGVSDRQRLIDDLTKVWGNAGKATQYVDGLSTSLKNIPKIENPMVSMTGHGAYTITAGGVTWRSAQGGFSGAERGMFVRGGTPGHDTVPILAQEGEAVVPAHLVPPIAPFLSAHGVPGFAAGGMIGSLTGSMAAWPGEMLQGFENRMAMGMTQAFQNSVQSLFSGGTGGAGVARWAPVILMALSMLGQPASLLGAVEYRMNRESGGNPLAVNNSDANARAGIPSTGAMQVIAPTFDAYAGPFRDLGPFLNGVSVNMLANVYAALNYALHVYGSIAAAMYQPGGYASGGVISEPIFGIGASGRGYTFGESGPELVTPLNRGGPRAATVIYHGDTYNITVRGDTNPDAAAQRIIACIREYKRHHGNQPTGIG